MSGSFWPVNIPDVKKLIKVLEREMKTAAKEYRFEKAAELRDKIKELRERAIA